MQFFFALSDVQHIFALMKIDKALQYLIDSDEFKEKAKLKDKTGGRLRMFLTRYQRGEIGTGTAVQLLADFGYEIDVINNKKQKP